MKGLVQTLVSARVSTAMMLGNAQAPVYAKIGEEFVHSDLLWTKLIVRSENKNPGNLASAIVEEESRVEYLPLRQFVIQLMESHYSSCGFPHSEKFMATPHSGKKIKDNRVIEYQIISGGEVATRGCAVFIVELADEYLRERYYERSLSTLMESVGEYLEDIRFFDATRSVKNWSKVECWYANYAMEELFISYGPPEYYGYATYADMYSDIANNVVTPGSLGLTVREVHGNLGVEDLCSLLVETYEEAEYVLSTVLKDDLLLELGYAKVKNGDNDE